VQNTKLRRECGQDYIDEGRYFYTIVIKKKEVFWQDEKYE